ncbi:hypothetical protein [Microvirga sp. M2]|uniref:hypothetical protein n=1 Tax=Microvirga sp. M2 TaxID=3073270 RepID=UPI0039C06D8F
MSSGWSGSAEKSRCRFLARSVRHDVAVQEDAAVWGVARATTSVEAAFAVMPGPEPGIHVFMTLRSEDVDGRNECGHDGENRD